jgi:hypothetical protein
MVDTLREYLCTFMIISRSIFFWGGEGEWESLQAKVVEEMKTHFSCSITFFRKSCCVWDNVENMVHPYRPQMTILYGARALHPGYPRLQTHIQNMQYTCFSTGTMIKRTCVYTTLHVRWLCYSKISGDQTFLSTFSMHCAKMAYPFYRVKIEYVKATSNIFAIIDKLKFYS